LRAQSALLAVLWRSLLTHQMKEEHMPSWGMCNASIRLTRPEKFIAFVGVWEV
jgi:hypothetical protein